MSVIQVLLAIGISVMMGVFVLQTVLQMKKVEGLMNLNSEAQDVEVGIQRLLMSPAACGNTLYLPMQSTPPGVGVINETKVKNGVPIQGIYGEQFDFTDPSKYSPIFAVGQTFGNGKLKIESIRMIRKKPGDPDPLTWANTAAMVYLEVVLQKAYLTNPTVTPTPIQKVVDAPGGERMVRRIPIVVQVDGDGNVTNCTSLSNIDLARKICEVDLEGKLTGASCSLADSPVVKKAVCDTLGMTWDNGTGCHH
jgi:hypothetical protein